MNGSRDYLDYMGTDRYQSDFDETREILAPSRSRTSTPSVAVRRAMQVLDETYRQQDEIRNQRWSRSNDRENTYFAPIRGRRSPSPIRSRSASPIRRSLRSPSPVRTPPRLVEIERNNFQNALGDSESRREILLKKLSDAQKTMELQNERIRSGEMDMNESRATIRLLQQVQQELETKTQFLQKERDNFSNRSRQDAEDREVLRRKIEESNRETNRTRCQLDLMLADKEQHHVTLEHLHKTIDDITEDKKNFAELQATTDNELISVKDRLGVSKQKCELLEKEKNHAFGELEKNQKAQQALINRNTDLGQRLARCQSDLDEVSHKCDKSIHELGISQEENVIFRNKIAKLVKDLKDLRSNHRDVVAERDRGVKYNLEMEKTIRSIKEINIEIKQAKLECDDNLTELHGEVARTRLELAKVCEQNSMNAGKLKDSRLHCKDLTSEVQKLRPITDELTSKTKDLEATNLLNEKQISLLEAQKNQLSREKEETSVKLSSTEVNLKNLELRFDEEVGKLNKTLNEVQKEKDTTALRLKDAEAQLTSVQDMLDSSMDHSKVKFEHWRQTCAKLTSMIEDKDGEIQNSALKRRESDEKCVMLEAELRALQMQLSEAATSSEELSHLRGENKRLGTECAENQQMIAVLEMQRDILAKSPSKSNSRESLLNSQVEKLEAELRLNKAKLGEAERSRSFDRSFTKSPVQQESSSSTAINKFLAEEIAMVKQELETTRGKLSASERQHQHDTTKFGMQTQQYNSRLALLKDKVNELETRGFAKSENKASKAELMKLKQKLEESKHREMVLEGELTIKENARRRSQDRISALEASNMKLQNQKLMLEARGDSTLDNAEQFKTETRRLKDENATLRMKVNEFNTVRSTQEGVIDALKEQLDSNDNSTESSEASKPSHKEMRSLQRELRAALDELESSNLDTLELKKKFLDSQKFAQKMKNERDELQGKTIIMESLNDSSQDLLKELEEVKEDKSQLEKQLSTFLSSKTSQTPPTSLSLADDLEKEMEKQYNTVCERNNWLENRINSLQREIELLRDQNQLLQEQRNTAEHEANKLREDLKEVKITSKGSKQRNEVKNIHLQHSNAEKVQQILDLERDLGEKTQIIHAMAREMKSSRRKSDKGKIAAFMKKLRRGSHGDGSKMDPDRMSFLFAPSTADGDIWTGRSGFESAPGQLDHSVASYPVSRSRRSTSLSPKSRPSSFGGFPKGKRHSKSPRIEAPLTSPTLTYVSDDLTESAPTAPSSGRRKSRQLSATRVSFDASSGEERENENERGEEEGVFYSSDYVQEDQIPFSGRRTSSVPSPEPEEPHPEEPHPERTIELPSPPSSPSLPSPSSSRRQRGKLPVFVVTGSGDESTGSEISLDYDPTHLATTPPGLVKSSFAELTPGRGGKFSRESERSPPPRPQSQPTLKGTSLSPPKLSTRKKHSSLV